MPCANCSSGPISTFAVQYFYNNQPTNCEDSECGSNSLNAKCVYYAGPNLSCSGVNTNDSVELALQKFDTKLCAVTADYSTYNFGCIDDGDPITNEGEFVAAITEFICNLKTTVDTFTTTTFQNYQSEVDDRFQAVEVPAIICSTASVVATDSLSTVLEKFCTKITAINSATSISGVDWAQCFTVSTPPTSIADAFSLVIDQICQVKGSGGATLPTFNNTGSCLPTPGAADSLSDTIGKIKTRLCQSPTLDNTTLTSTCVSIPGTATDLQTLLQNIINKVDTLTQAAPTFDPADFNITNVNNAQPCAGKLVQLVTPINQDRFVASNASDTSPGALIDKLQAGTGISLDDTTTPGKVIITASGGGSDDKTVKANTADDTPGFLDQKITQGVSDDGIALDITYNPGTKKLVITPQVDMDALTQSLLVKIATDGSLRSQFCNLVSSCTTNPPPEGPSGGYQAYVLEKYQCSDCTLLGTVSAAFPDTYSPVIGKFYLEYSNPTSGFIYKVIDLNPDPGPGIILQTIPYNDCASGCAVV